MVQTTATFATPAAAKKACKRWVREHLQAGFLVVWRPETRAGMACGTGLVSFWSTRRSGRLVFGKSSVATDAVGKTVHSPPALYSPGAAQMRYKGPQGAVVQLVMTVLARQPLWYASVNSGLLDMISCHNLEAVRIFLVTEVEMTKHGEGRTTSSPYGQKLKRFVNSIC
jgi:hypothetical protein